MTDENKLGTMRPTPNAQRPTPNAQRPTLNYTQKDEIIHVVLCVYDSSGKYSQHAGVVMTSIFENTKSKILIHVLHDKTLTEDNRKKFIRTAEKYSQGLDLVNVAKYEDELNEDIREAVGKFTIGTLFRLLIPDALSNLKKVISLDCDIVVNLDIKELWDIPFEGNSIIGIQDSGLMGLGERTRHKLNGSSFKSYMNWGVTVINLESIRQRGNLLHDFLQWYSKHTHLMASMSDQDFINVFCNGSIKYIDERFNRFSPATEEKCANAIVHTPGALKKIWDVNGELSQKLYWENYLRSAWGENKTPAEIVEILSNAAIKSSLRRTKHFHATAAPCIKNSIISIPRKIFWTNPPVLAMRYIIRDFLHKLKRK